MKPNQGMKVVKLSLKPKGIEMPKSAPVSVPASLPVSVPDSVPSSATDSKVEPSSSSVSPVVLEESSSSPIPEPSSSSSSEQSSSSSSEQPSSSAPSSPQEKPKPIYKVCVIGDLTARQKIMTTKMMREAPYAVIAMDEYNAEQKGLVNLAEFLVIFEPGQALFDDSFVTKMQTLGWTLPRILIEGDNFEPNGFPKF